MKKKLNLCLSGRVFELSYSENALSLEEFFKTAFNNGFTCVELRDSQININSSEKDIKALNKLSEKFNIPVALITSRKGRLDNDNGYEIFEKYLKLAEKINCKEIKISGKNPSLIKKAASDAEKKGIKVGTNNHLGTPLATIDGTIKWFQKIDHPNYYLHFDPSHLWLNGENQIEKFIETMIERISYTIIQDYYEHPKGELLGIRNVSPISVDDTGSVGYPSLIKKLINMNFKGPFSLVYLKNSINLSNNKLKEHFIKYFNYNEE